MKKIIVRNKGNENMNILHVLKLFSNHGVLQLEKFKFYHDEFVSGGGMDFDVDDDKLELLTDGLSFFNVKYEVIG